MTNINNAIKPESFTTKDEFKETAVFFKDGTVSTVMLPSYLTHKNRWIVVDDSPVISPANDNIHLGRQLGIDLVNTRTAVVETPKRYLTRISLDSSSVSTTGKTMLHQEFMFECNNLENFNRLRLSLRDCTVCDISTSYYNNKIRLGFQRDTHHIWLDLYCPTGGILKMVGTTKGGGVTFEIVHTAMYDTKDITIYGALEWGRIS